MLITILVVLAIVFALLALFSVPSKVSWTALGVLALATVHLLGSRLV